MQEGRTPYKSGHQQHPVYPSTCCHSPIRCLSSQRLKPLSLSSFTKDAGSKFQNEVALLQRRYTSGDPIDFGFSRMRRWLRIRVELRNGNSARNSSPMPPRRTFHRQIGAESPVAHRKQVEDRKSSFIGDPRKFIDEQCGTPPDPFDLSYLCQHSRIAKLETGTDMHLINYSDCNGRLTNNTGLCRNESVLISVVWVQR